MNSRRWSGIMRHVLKVFGWLIEVGPPPGNAQFDQRLMFSGPPSASFWMRKIKECTFAGPEVKRIGGAVIVFSEIALGERFGIIPTLLRNVRFFDHHQVKPLVLEFGDHGLRVRPVKGLKG